MKLLERVQKYGQEQSDAIAISSGHGELTYGQLVEYSDKIAQFLEEVLGENKDPVMVYGHKHPFMLVYFLACVKSGRAYCPVDVTVPKNRIEDIAKTIETPYILATEELFLEGFKTIDLEQSKKVILEKETGVAPEKWLKPEEVFYIIFTSGSTGKPKGVQITYDNLENFVAWSSQLAKAEGRQLTYMNQAPFSFDLSVMDLYTCLYTGGTLWPIEKHTQNNMGDLVVALKNSRMAVWVSTPSFADICLLNPEFDSTLIPKLETFMFCGETLTVETARRLRERFPKTRTINLYGPTEATVSATAIEVTEELLKTNQPLPVGSPHVGTQIYIMGQDGEYLEEGKRGEIIICGNTVSPGYYKDVEKTKEVFLSGNRYKTGDEGYLDKGVLHYVGRLDLQIKMHGYRIELGDIESNLLQLEGVKGVAVLPKYKDEKIRSLVAFLVPEELPEKPAMLSKQIKEKMKGRLPEYMIPKKFVFLEKLPMTANGKIDRKILKEQL